jgi:hypothetical protein
MPEGEAGLPPRISLHCVAQVRKYRKCSYGEAGGLVIICVTTSEWATQVMKPNYQFEKRQRELEKKKKKAEKADKKTVATEVPAVDETVVAPEDK